MTEDLFGLDTAGDENPSEADRLIESGQLEAAERMLITLHQRHPDFADVCNKLGQLYHGKGDYLRAKEFLSRAVTLNPNYTEASLNLAVTLNEMKQYGRAKEVVEQAQVRAARKRSNLDPFVAGKLANKHKELGDIYRQLGMLSDCVEEYRKALNLSPTFADIQVKMGVVLREMGRIEDALEALVQATETRPDFSDARIQLGITYFSQGFLDRARQEWEEVLAASPENRKARMYLGFLQEQKS